MAQLASGAEMDNTGKTGSCEEAEVVKEKQKDVIVISPTGFNPNNMPSAKVTAAKTRGNSLRVKINKLLGECTEQVALILELTGQISESMETSAETEEEIDECQEELKSLFDKVKSYNDEHNEACFELSQMLSFISETQEILGETKQMNEAKQMIKKNEEWEKQTDEEVKRWKRENYKWLRKKKKFVQTGQRMREEVKKQESTDFALIKLMENRTCYCLIMVIYRRRIDLGQE